MRTSTNTFGALLVDAKQSSRPTKEVAYLRYLRRRLLIPAAIVIALFAAWAAYAPLSGAVIAPAQIKVELNRKTVQHQEGGIVREVLVRDGQKVRAGEPLILVGDLRSQAELNLLRNQLLAERIRIARATAEATLATSFKLPDDSQSPQAAEYAAREKTWFDARRRTLDEQIGALETQSRESQAQAIALQSQIDATEASVKLAADELALNEKLARDGFVQRAHLLPLQRAEADYRSKVGESRSELALARQRAADFKARIAQTRNQYQQQAADELKEATAKLQELEERLQPSLDQVERQTVRSPVDGEVMALRVSGAGAVVAPREALLDIVPSQERLLLEAHIRPQDINHVRRDADAEVRLTSFDTRTTPSLNGKVTFVSGDRVTSTDGHDSFFVADVEVDAANLKRHPEIKLQAGMPAELYIVTGKRTLFDYFTRPLSVFAHRAMREP
jgi:HlyD family type I secretion membrane fusion protein